MVYVPKAVMQDYFRQMKGDMRKVAKERDVDIFNRPVPTGSLLYFRADFFQQVLLLQQDSTHQEGPGQGQQAEKDGRYAQ